MRNEGYYYSYVACYYDYLISVHKYYYHVLESIRVNGFTIKETLTIYYFLGGYFKHFKYPKTDNNILKWVSKKCVKRMMENFKNTFGFDPSNQYGVMPPDYKHEIDTT